MISRIAKLRGRLKNLQLEGKERPLAQIVKKVNEIIEVVNKCLSQISR